MNQRMIVSTFVLSLLLCICINQKVYASEQLATIVTGTVSNITSSGATVSGNITSDGGSSIIERGIVFATFPNPDLTIGTKVTASGTTGPYSVTFSDLRLNATYHVRAYTVNSQGISYGEDVTFQTNHDDSGIVKPNYDFYAVFSPIKYDAPSFVGGVTAKGSAAAITTNQLSLTDFRLDLKRVNGKYYYRYRAIGESRIAQSSSGYLFEEFTPLYPDNITLSIYCNYGFTEPYSAQGANIFINNDTDRPINIIYSGPAQYPQNIKVNVEVNKGELQFNKQQLPSNQWTNQKNINLKENDASLNKTYASNDLSYLYPKIFTQISSNGKYIIDAKKNILKIYDTESNSLKSINTTADISGISISTDNKLVAVQNSESITIWSLPDGTLLKQFPQINGFSLFSPDNKLILSSNGLFSIYDLDTDKTVGQVEYARSASYVLSSDSGKIAEFRTYLEGNNIGIYDTSSGNLLCTISPNSYANSKTGLTFSPDGKSIITNTAESSVNNNGIIKVWDSTTGNLKYIVDNGTSFDNFLLTYDGTKLITMLRSKGLIQYWDLNSGILIRTFSVSNCYALDISPDDSLLAIGASNDGTYVYQLSDGSLMKHTQNAFALEFSPDGTFLAEKDNGNIDIVKTKDWTIGQTIINGYTASSNDPQYRFSSDSQYLIAQYSYPDGYSEAKLWKIDSATQNSQEQPVYLSTPSMTDGLEDYIPVLIKINTPSKITSGTFYFDGTVIGSISPTLTKCSFYAPLATDFISPGSHHLSFIAVDTQGNTYKTETDCVIKQVSLNVPSELTVDLTGQPVEVQADLLPDLENNYTFFWDNTSAGIIHKSSDLFGINPNGNKVVITPLKCGTGLLTVKAGGKEEHCIIDVINSAAKAPAISSSVISGITYTGAKVSGSVRSDPDNPVSECGIVYDTSVNPELEGGTKENTYLDRTGNFVVSLTNLSQNTTYYVRIYAVTANGISYGDDAAFSTKECPSMITTVAGNSMQGYAGDGNAATAAQLNNPTGVAVDSAGNLYIADTNNNRIRKVGPHGIISTIAGNGESGYSGNGGPAVEAQLNNPAAVVIDGAGNLYIADTSNNCIRKVTPDGIITTIAGSGERWGNYSGDGGLATNAELRNPQGIALDKAGNLYIADTGNNRIRKVGTDGIISTVAGNGYWNYSGDGLNATNAQINEPNSIAVDGFGNLYIADTYNYRVRKVGTDGIISTIAGNPSGYLGDGLKATDARLERPEGVAIDSEGNLYISSNYISKVGPDGIILTVAGNETLGYSGDGGVSCLAALNEPSGIAFDNKGNLYIADTANNSIRIVSNITPSVYIKADPIVQIGADPSNNDYVGIYVGLDNITDSNGNTIINPNVAGYRIEVDYDQTKLNIANAVDEAHLGQFENESSDGKLIISDASTDGTTSFNKLFFLPIKITGSALDLTSLQVKYLSVNDFNNNQIAVETPAATQFQRGKILNEGPEIQSNIQDAVAGLQYLAGLHEAGLGTSQVNLVNMASILPPGQGTTPNAPSVKDVIALLQYFAGLRDTFFLPLK